MIMLATQDDEFAWLRSLSELMARLDELRKLPTAASDQELHASVRAAVEALIAPAAGHDTNAFAAKYRRRGAAWGEEENRAVVRVFDPQGKRVRNFRVTRK
jgi:hypothetical protein